MWIGTLANICAFLICILSGGLAMLTSGDALYLSSISQLSWTVSHWKWIGRWLQVKSRFWAHHITSILSQEVSSSTATIHLLTCNFRHPAASLNGAIVNTSIFKVTSHWLIGPFVCPHVNMDAYYMQSAFLIWKKKNQKHDQLETELDLLDMLHCLTVQSQRKLTGAICKFLK